MSDKKESKPAGTDDAAANPELSDEDLDGVSGGVTAAASRPASTVGKIVGQVGRDLSKPSELLESLSPSQSAGLNGKPPA